MSATDDSTKAGSSAPAEADGNAASAEHTGTFPKSPQVDVVWQNTVVDIEAVSRFREDEGPDRANVITTLALPEEADSEAKDFFDGLDDVEVTYLEGGRLVQLEYWEEVEQTENGETVDTYEYTVDAPLPFADIPKNGDVSAVAHLPRPALEYDEDDAPLYDIQLEDIGDEGVSETFEPDEDAQRTSVYWHARIDDPWTTVYSIVKRLP